MPYLTLSFPLGTRSPDEVEAACTRLGALSLTLSDSRDDPVLEPRPGEVRLWRSTQVQALFESTASITFVVDELAATLGLERGSIAHAELEDRIWEREWLKDFHAQRFGKRLWICPHHENAGEPGDAIVRLDPGLAFGTGHHPSTALCLEWLDAVITGGECVIDYGCGSGILALAALKLGAARAHCFDIDPQALLATSQNADSNLVGDQLRIHAEAASLPRADIIVANILSGPLIELAPSLAGLALPGARIALAGLMTSERDHVTAAYAPWFDIECSVPRDGWIRLSGTRRT